MKRNKFDTRRWGISNGLRLGGIITWTIFILCIESADTLQNAIISLALIFLTFLFIFVIPDKIIFQKYLVKREMKE